MEPYMLDSPCWYMVLMHDEHRARLLRVKQYFCAFVVSLVWVVLGPLDATAAILTVTSANDSGAGSLRQAILDANATNGLDTIVFQIPGAGVHTLAVLSALPTISDAAVIDGTSQPGYAGTPLIELNGASAGAGSDGLRLPAGSSTIRGLAINRFGGAGIHVQLPGRTNFIQGNFIGTDPTGTLSRGNGSAAQSGGVWVDSSSDNWIGGPYPTNRNVISANTGPGVYLLNCAGNTVQGNLIGTSVSGTAALGNSNNGISLNNAPGNVAGGTLTGARNLISGNGGSGIYLNGSGTTGNVVQGNYIGTDANGSLAMPNAGDGVTVNGAPANTIGGAVAGAGNLLSGNSQGGISLNGTGAVSNLVQGNYIGTDPSGKLALGNLFSGVTIFGGNSNLIGGATSAARNVISANKLAGILVTTNSTGNLVQGNFVGVDATGATALGNAVNGISIVNAGANTVGGATPGARNVISGNTGYGIEMFGTGATGNAVQGNYIGLAVSGLSALANHLCGVHILSSGNTVGGVLSGAGNLISGNGQDGIFLDGAGAANNLVQGNLIGTVAAGTSGLGNGRAGVGVSGAPGNTIGGATAGAGNLLSANGDAGIYLIASGATGNLIQGNTIGTDLTGTIALGNTYEGVYAERSPSNTIGGAVSGAGNLISGNNTRGIWLTNASWNAIQGNLIGTRSDGISGLGNTFHNLECEVGACNNTIGGMGWAGNRIAFAQSIYAGVRIRNGSTNNAILGNAIFSNGALGIDLGSAGPNANISCGTGSGANMAQNYPVLAQAVTGTGTGVRGSLNSRANNAFLLEFFANSTCDSSGYGEGQIYLGQMSVVTGNDCNAGFVAGFPRSVPVGYSITATATDSANNTSEFSPCITAGPVPALRITPATSHQVSIAWTNTTTGFGLKQTTSLSPPIQWTAVTNVPVVINGQFVVTLSAATGNRFYVLRFQ